MSQDNPTRDADVNRMRLTALYAISSLMFLGGQQTISAEPPRASQTNSIPAMNHYQRGRLEAEQDLASGKAAVKTFGLPAPWSGTYRDILLKKYNIHSDAIAGCVVGSEETEYARGYNEVSKLWITQKFGADVFEKASAEAQRQSRTVPGTNDSVRTYTVKAGDTLSGIAEMHRTSWEKLKMLNNLSSDRIKPGQKLKIPQKK